MIRRLLAATWIACLAGTGLASAAPCQGDPTSAKLEITIDNVDQSQGLMTASLYPGDPTQFLIKNGALKVWSVPAEAPVTHMCIWLPKGPGVYAFAVFHDANSNGKWDHALLHKIEGFGFSNNPHTTFSAPSYESVKFHAGPGETVLHVRLRYP